MRAGQSVDGAAEPELVVWSSPGFPMTETPPDTLPRLREGSISLATPQRPIPQGLMTRP
jgi:hypothetical protein